MKYRQNPSISAQEGAALIVSLIILLVMTLLGTASMRITSLEEKMTGNTRDLNLAFQAAEAALRDGEELIDSIVSIGGAFTNTNGLYNGNEPDYTNSASWATANSRAYPDAGVVPVNTAVALVNSQPRYYITWIADGIGTVSNSSGTIGGYGQQQAGSTISVFSVTARGTGGSDNTAVILRSVYGRQ